MVLTYSVCNVSVLPLKKEPSHRSEQVSQLLFGEKAEVLEINERDWALIRTDWDQYEGWCRASQLQLVPKREYLRQPKYLAAGTMDRYQFEDGDIWVPRGAQVYKSSLLMHGMKGKFKGKKVKTKELKADRDRVKEAALSYMYAPYLWGGKTIAGIDCSGLSQMAYRLCNLRIPRDANEQANAGEVVDFLQHAEPGDLAFFDNAEGHINHVGILIDRDHIIHASESNGRVAIDRIDLGGIISRTLRKRTHNLRVVKRYL